MMSCELKGSFLYWASEEIHGELIVEEADLIMFPRNRLRNDVMLHKYSAASTEVTNVCSHIPEINEAN
jgi:hypothetical protein